MRKQNRSPSTYGFFAVLLASVFFFGCTQPMKVPLETIRYDAGERRGPHYLFVFLPGNGDPVTVFAQKGFIEAVRARKLPVDMISVNAHLGYYENGTVFTRLKKDVIDPARAKGYDQVWMIGTSLGGYGSLFYACEFPEELTGVVLLGPFLGEKPLVQEIMRAGGVQQWDPGPMNSRTQATWEKLLWLRLKDCENEKGFLSNIYMGYGRNDRFSVGQDFLASLLPPEHVIVMDGGHDWSTWQKLWNRFLDRIFIGQ
jgi:hypothetical protein